MSYESLEPILNAMSLPTITGEWGADEVPVWPFLEYHLTGDGDFAADGKSYYKRDSWNVSIYNKSEDMFTFWNLCEALEAELDSEEIQYTRSPDIFPGDGIVYADYSFYLAR